MKFKKFAILGAMVGTLIGCAQAEIMHPPVNIVPNVASDAVGLDVYAGPRSRGNPVPEFRGQNTVQVRTFEATRTGTKREIPGVQCTLDSGIYKATFTTPANLIVPDYGQNSPALFVRCTTPTTSGSVTMNVTNMTAQDRSATTMATGVVGAILIGAVNGTTRDNVIDDFDYNPILVQLR